MRNFATTIMMKMVVLVLVAAATVVVASPPVKATNFTRTNAEAAAIAAAGANTVYLKSRPISTATDSSDKVGLTTYVPTW